MDDWLTLFQSISREVYRKVHPLFGSARAGEVAGRGAGGDITRRIDILAEEIVIKLLEMNDVSCILVSEERGTKVIGDDAGDYVVLDGIDGTTNAVKGISFVSTSIAHATGPYLKDVDVGLVMDLSGGITFSAEKGSGAYEEMRPLRPSSVTDVKEGLISIELPGKMKMGDILPSLTRLTPLITNVRNFRHLGSTALELCYVASGRLDAFVDIRGIIRATDFAAAYLITREAGALIVTLDGEEIEMVLEATSRTPFIAAANQPLCREVLRLLVI